ncbi:MAG TPA: type I-B CRISPR-associated protein Cas7/Cst2/DevR [Candidatus Angelobacter sp.]|jgi:CRISPR-associated protein Cst2|nr:type I-B CRISPR-associated protein Cas7/Cst2/DevR [Candidatus Angelobacter sp.]
MSHLSGLLLVDCPASALNNAGAETGARTDNVVAVKKIRTKAGIFPYVSAQAFRYWLREALKGVEGWSPSPTFREEKIAYTDANPIAYAEDDIFGYMRAPSTKTEAIASREEKGTLKSATPIEEKTTLTRSSVLKMSTLVSIAASEPVDDFGVMARHEGNPVPHEHEFYRTTLMGLFSVDLRMLGRFYHVNRTGYKHLDSVRKELAAKQGLKPHDNDRAFELPLDVRRERLKQLLQGLSQIAGGAKLALHYTDVSPRLLMLAVSKGGNHLFGTAVGADGKGLPKLNTAALKQVAEVYKDSLLSKFHIGLVEGYVDDQRTSLAEAVGQINGDKVNTVPHPVQAINQLLAELDQKSREWLA